MPPPPTKSADNRAQFNTGKRSGDHATEYQTSSNVQALVLLAALRNVVIPIVQTALPTEKDLRDLPFGPEAEDLLVALQNYVASIIRYQSDNEAGDGTAAQNPSSGEEQSTAGVHSTGAPDNKKRLEGSKLISASRALRQHVFDAMPIRLLHFKTYGSKFEITLVEREQMHTELLKRLRGELDENATPEDINETVSKIAQYSILSHTWLRDGAREVTYNDWLKGDYDTEQPGYQKLLNFCKSAAEHGFTYGWMDTVCINKASSAELDESIRSMYRWYSRASICITYLAATTDVSSMDADPWFGRGWTLQEMIAPKYLKFYDKNWNKLVNDSTNDKTNPLILGYIESRTNISANEMIDLASVPISTKMKWAAWREVTRGEDTAYSLIGIMNVDIPIAYGEGSEKAFLRLLKAVLNTAKHDIIEIFNWFEDYATKDSALLPSSPRAYYRASHLSTLNLVYGLIQPVTFTYLGLRIPILLLSAMATTTAGTSYQSIGDYSSTVRILTSMPDIPRDYNLLERKTFPTNSPSVPDSRIVFAVLNFDIDEDTIVIPKKCFAVAVIVSTTWELVKATDFKQRIPTRSPIVFTLRGPNMSEQPCYYLERKMLRQHGMRQLDMIL